MTDQHASKYGLNLVAKNLDIIRPYSELDPADWKKTKSLAHNMVDDMLDFIASIRNHPVWMPLTDDVRQNFMSALPHAPTPVEKIYQEFSEFVLPYALKNIHPMFMGWAQGSGTIVGVLSEILSASLNANVGGRDQSPLEVEKQVIRWMMEAFRFPETASGVFVTGSSMANFLALLIARTARIGKTVRHEGIGIRGNHLRIYASEHTHGCLRKAVEAAGMGTQCLQTIPVDETFRINIAALRQTIAKDRAGGQEPLMIVGNAGTVDVGAVDNLEEIHRICCEEKLWFHIDGAFGALGILSPHVAPRLAGIELADSLAFDFHKWGHVPYDAGFLLVRERRLHYDTFCSTEPYLMRDADGLMGASPWPCDYGMDLSRGFRALKTWFTLKTFGTDAIGRAIELSCANARYLAARILSETELELLAPVELNILCFRYKARDADKLNKSIVRELQGSGLAAPSATTLKGRFAIRVAIFNHRTTEADLDHLIDAVLAIGKRLVSSSN